MTPREKSLESLDSYELATLAYEVREVKEAARRELLRRADEEGDDEAAWLLGNLL